MDGKGKVVGGDGVTRKEDIKSIQPTILLGLGGTGKEVLLRLRQRFFEKYGLVGFPAMQYFWIDTDMQNNNIDGKPLDYLAREVEFDEDEKIDIQVQGEDFMAIFGRPNANHHIFRWMDPSLKALGSVINGARQIRLLGRLSFFHHAYMNNDIRGRLGKSRDYVQSQAVRRLMQNEYGITVGKGLQIILVSSLAGGTGSGIFLDTAFMVRDGFKASNPDIVGFLVLPPVFSTDLHHAESLYANAYSALKELEYYSMRKDALEKDLTDVEDADGKTVSAHDFVVEWRPGQEKIIQGPPFNTCYLVNNKTEVGGSIGPQHKTDLCDMIAENLFLDFASQVFSAKKRSVRNNLDDYLTNELEYEYRDDKGNPIHSEIFSFRFSAFGLSKIYVPVDRIRKACAFKLGAELLAFWMKDNPIEGDANRHLRRKVLPELQLRVAQNVDDFRNALWTADEQGNTFLRIIENQWQGSERSALKQRLDAKQTGIAKEFERRFLAYAEVHLAIPKEKEKWGSFVKRLYNTNKKQWLKASKNRIVDLVRTWMNSPYYRGNATIEYLRELNRILKDHAKYFQGSSERAEKAGKDTFVRIRQYQEILTEEEGGTWLHKWSIQEINKVLCRAATDHFVHRTMSLVYRIAKEICEELQEFIGEQTVRERPDQEDEVIRKGLIQQIWSLQEQYLTLHGELEASLTSFEHTSPHLIFENLYETGMFEDYYRLQKSADKMVPVDEDELPRLEEMFRGRLEMASLFDLLQKKKQIGLENIRKELNNFCLQQFLNIKLDVDAIHRLYERYQQNPKRIDEIIERFAANGRVWVKKDALAAADDSITQNYAEEIELGVYQKGLRHSNYKDFLEKVQGFIQKSALRGPMNPPLDVEPDAVYLYNEYAGIPLMYIEGLEQYRQAYLSQSIRHKRSLHIDREEDKFQDILIKKPEDVKKTIRINKALLVGAILRVIDIEVDVDGQINYRYQDREAFPPVPHPLGNQYLAVETLRQNDFLLKKIEKNMLDVLRRLESDLSGRQRFFTTLTFHTVGDDFEEHGISPGPYPPKWVKVGNSLIRKFDPEHRAITNAITSEKQGLIDAMGTDDQGLNELFIDYYRSLDQYTEIVKVDGKILRLLKKEIVGTN